MSNEMPEYTRWLEGFVKRLLSEPQTVEGIAVAVVGNDNTIETGYWQCSMADKLLIGIIQQDAMLQTLAANADDEIEDEEEKDD